MALNVCMLYHMNCTLLSILQALSSILYHLCYTVLHYTSSPAVRWELRWGKKLRGWNRSGWMRMYGYRARCVLVCAYLQDGITAMCVSAHADICVYVFSSRCKVQLEDRRHELRQPHAICRHTIYQESEGLYQNH